MSDVTFKQECDDCGEVLDAKGCLNCKPELDPDYDPTPWCTWCGAKTHDRCGCGPFAENH
jgi:hypothetical protein